MTTWQNAKHAAGTSRRLGRRSLVVAVVWTVLGLAFVERSVAWAEAPPPDAFVVVVNAHNLAKSVERQFLADAFLKRASRWADDETLRPADLRPDSAARRAFSLSVVRRSVAAVRSYWQQCIFSGREIPPPELDNDAAMLRYVAKYRGAVGYVSANATLGDGVKTLTVR